MHTKNTCHGVRAGVNGKHLKEDIWLSENNIFSLLFLSSG